MSQTTRTYTQVHVLEYAIFTDCIFNDSLSSFSALNLQEKSACVADIRYSPVTLDDKESDPPDVVQGMAFFLLFPQLLIIVSL